MGQEGAVKHETWNFPEEGSYVKLGPVILYILALIKGAGSQSRSCDKIIQLEDHLISLRFWAQMVSNPMKASPSL